MRNNFKWPALFERVPDDPFYLPRRPLYHPSDMREAPRLPPAALGMRPQPRLALLVDPFYAKDPHGSFGKHVLTPGVTLTTLAAHTPEGWTVRCWDENLLQGAPPSEPLPQAVGITVHLTFARRAYELAAWYRAQGATVILGGLHVQSCPEEAARHADAIALGDGALTWPQFLRDLERNAVQPVYRGDFDAAGALEAAPRRELLPRASFLTTASLIATRGCSNRCGFCYLSTEGLRMPYRALDAGEVARQARGAAEPYVVFIDNNLGARPDYLRELCRALRPLRVIWSAAVTLDVTNDASLVRDMALSGCTGVFVGLETLNDANLRQARKRAPQAGDYARRVRIFQDHGIQVNGSFVLGFDGDSRDVFQETAGWIEDNRLECATFHILTPYPGTPMFRQLEAEGRLLHRDWSLYDTAHVVFRPRRMEPEELALGYDWLYRRLFSLRSIWRRRPSEAGAVPNYLAMSVLYKRANPLWHLLIRRQWVHAMWSPLVRISLWRHRLARHCQSGAMTVGRTSAVPSSPVPAGV